MDAAAALAEAKRLAAGGQVRFTRHALARMTQRRVTQRDVFAAVAGAMSAALQTSGTWAIAGGHDTDDCPLTVVVAFEADMIVVTLF